MRWWGYAFTTRDILLSIGSIGLSLFACLMTVLSRWMTDSTMTLDKKKMTAQSLAHHHSRHHSFIIIAASSNKLSLLPPLQHDI
jgi:hypothetical protein